VQRITSNYYLITHLTDVQQTIMGSCKPEDIAFKVLTRVKGHYPDRNQLLVDAGFLAMSHDGNDGRKEMDGGLCWVEGHPELRYFISDVWILFCLIKLTQNFCV